MATTTNYSWTTPDDTDLVKDGAAAIRSLGTAIDTTVFNNADAAIAKTIVDAKGDIIAATAADTVARLAVGANDTVLTADSSTATGLKWATPAAGAYTVIASGSIAASATGLDLTSISASYTDLKLYITDLSINATAISENILFRLNNDSGNNYESTRFQNSAATLTNSVDGTAFSSYALPDATDDTSIIVELPNYANTTAFKICNWLATNNAGTITGSSRGFGAWTATPAAINRITMTVGAGAFDGGSYILYGVK